MAMAMPVSDSQARPIWLISGRNIHSRAATRKATPTRFSALLMAPSALSSRLIISPLSAVSDLKEKGVRVSHHQVMAHMAMATGRPTSIHWAKPISMP